MVGGKKVEQSHKPDQETNCQGTQSQYNLLQSHPADGKEKLQFAGCAGARLEPHLPQSRGKTRSRREKQCLSNLEPLPEQKYSLVVECFLNIWKALASEQQEH